MRFFVLFVLLSLNISLLAQEQQENQKLEIIYFKNGSIIKGKILNENKTDYQIEMLGGDIITVSKKNVSITKTVNLKNAIFIENGLTLQTKGHYAVYTFNLLAGSSTYGYSDIVPSLSIIHGYQFDQNLSIGVGTGIDIYDYTLIPIFLDIRGYPRKKRLSPFYAFDFGYGFPVRESSNWSSIRGGLMLNPSLGFRFLGRRESSLHIGIGYKKQFVTRDYRHQDYSDEIVFNRLQFQVGMMF